MQRTFSDVREKREREERTRDREKGRASGKSVFYTLAARGKRQEVPFKP